MKHVLPAVVKPARTLWNEVIGFFFCCFGVIFAFHTVRYFRAGETVRMIFAGGCALIMLYYGISSFLRARKISRS